MVWLKFLLCLIIILFAGTKLARYGDAIAEKTGLGRIWIGLLLLAVVTTMPELATGISSAVLVQVPDLALGTFLGSCIFNLSIIAILDILHRKTPVLSNANLNQIIAAGTGISLVALIAGGIFAGEGFCGLSIGWVGISSIIIALLYLIGARILFNFEKKQISESLDIVTDEYDNISSKEVYSKFALSSIFVIGAGIWLSLVGEEIARTTGWDASFVGSLFLAISTSMPELVVSISAVRLGAIDMAIADILGANMLDILGIAITDIFFVQEPILAAVSEIHITTALIVIIMTSLVIIGLVFRQKSKTFTVASWYAPLLIGLYIFGAYALFNAGIG
ncbi:sodium:calcium antiporter [Chloroflexota bacterium]